VPKQLGGAAERARDMRRPPVYVLKFDINAINDYNDGLQTEAPT
jgi:hypothetical protein